MLRKANKTKRQIIEQLNSRVLNEQTRYMSKLPSVSQEYGTPVLDSDNAKVEIRMGEDGEKVIRITIGNKAYKYKLGEHMGISPFPGDPHLDSPFPGN
tara:strand:- start:30 stop:323 length:294 start_codon:yes stop_codon:yes gene_type:complete